MCGVVGYYPVESLASQQDFADLFGESTIRGLHAFGLAQSSHDVIRSFEVKDIIAAFDPSRPTIAHARYCTSGNWRVLENNQPVVVDSLVLVFNGVIHMGTKEEMEEEFNVSLSTDNDGEVFLRCREDRMTPWEIIGGMKGSFAGLWFDIDGKMYAGRNARRPLWRCDHLGARWYASTRDIFLRAGFPEPEEVSVGVEDACS